MIFRCRGVRAAMWFAAASLLASNLLEISRLLERAFAGAQFAVAERLLDEIYSACLHGLNRHGHVAVARNHDGGQLMVRMAQLLQ